MIFKEMTDEALMEAASLFARAFNNPPWNDRWTEEKAFHRLSAMLHAEQAFGLCMYDRNRLCGIALGHIEEYYDGKEFLLKEFAVDNDLRGKGWGTMMMEELQKRLKKQDVERIVLITLSDERTIGFYRHQGFEIDATAVIMKTTL